MKKPISGPFQMPQLLVRAFARARCSNCGDTLRVFTTTCLWKHLQGPRLIAVPNGKNVKNWAIRSQGSKDIHIT